RTSSPSKRTSRTTRASRTARSSRRRSAKGAGSTSASACGDSSRPAPRAHTSCWPTSSLWDRIADMETPLTPLEFVRRTRALYPNQEAVVDGDLRLSYEQFFERCDRWSAALQKLGVAQGDRVAYIAPNTHAQLESFYAVPQIGAVLVPINYR